MRIQKKRINTLQSNLPQSLHEKEFIPGAVVDINLDRHVLTDLGFSEKLEVGETVLPPIIGSVTRFNAEGKCVADKSEPKDTIYWDTEWTRQQWAGRGKTEEVTDIVTHSRQVWHKDHVSAPGVELTIAKKADGQVLITTPSVSMSDTELAKHSINLILEVFSYCDLLTEDGVPVIKQPKRVNWQILPPGKRPWPEQKKLLEPVLSKVKSKNKVKVYEQRFEDLYKLGPNDTSVGLNGYQGYVIFHFNDKNIHVLESVIYGNAIYIFDEDWEKLSQKTKAEILRSGKYVNRFTHIGHRVNIIEKIEKLLQ